MQNKSLVASKDNKVTDSKVFKKYKLMFILLMFR